MFIFNTDILLIDVGFTDGLVVIAVTTLGMLAFCSATQRYMFTANRLWETVAFLLIAFTLFRPDFWLDRVSPPFIEVPGHEIVAQLDRMQGTGADGELLRVRISGPDFDDADRIIDRSLILELPEDGPAIDRIETAGLLLSVDDGKAVVEEPFPGTPLFQQLGGFDFYADRQVTLDVVLIDVPGRPPREWFYIPAVILLLGIAAVQRRRALRAASSG